MGVLVRERPEGSGIYWVYINHKGKRKAQKVGDKKAANTIARRVEERLASGDLGLFQEVKQSPIFEKYAQQWLDGHAKTSCKHSTWQRYEVCLRKYLFPVFGDTPIDRIQRKDIKKFIYSKLAEGLSASSVRNIKAVLSGVLSSAYEDELILGNPALRLGKLIKKNDYRKDINPLTKEEVLVMLQTAQEHFPQYYPVFLLAGSTGMRLGEVIGLQPGDVDFKGRFIEVQRAIVRGRVETPKSGKSRRVDMSLQLAAVLKVHLIRTKELTLKRGGQQQPETLFYNNEGRPLDQDNLVKRVFYKCLEKAGLRRVRFHDLRHTFASIHISQGESLAYVRDQLGHHSIQITVDIYGHLVPGSNKSAADRLLHMQPAATYTQPEDVEPQKKHSENVLSA